MPFINFSNVVTVLLALILFVLILFSFNTSQLNITFEGFTLKWYGELFKNTTLLLALKNTLIVAIVSTVVSTVIGTISAYGLYKYDFPLKKIVNRLLYIPVVIPEIVLGISLLAIYTVFKLELGMTTLILAHISFSIPFVIINVRNILEQMDGNLILAANDLGASKLKTFLYVTIPSALSDKLAVAAVPCI